MQREVFHRDTWFEGYVQGVGFRANVVQVARGYEVTGTVKNLPDGRVHLHAEGQRAEVQAFLEEVRRQLKSYIRREESREFLATARCTTFQIAV